MKKHFPTIVALTALVAVTFTLRTPRSPGEYDLNGFGRLPTLVNGRVKPLDTVARTSLLLLQGRQRVVALDSRHLTPSEWLLDVLYHGELANTYQTFEIVQPEVLALFGLAPEQGAGGKRFSVNQLTGNLAELDRQARLADTTEGAGRTSFQRAVVQLRDALSLYQRLQGSATAAGEDRIWEKLAAAPAARDERATAELTRTLTTMDQFAYLRLAPPLENGASQTWQTLGAAWTDQLAGRNTSPGASAYLALGRAWRERDPAAFNAAVASYRAQLDRTLAAAMRKCDVEVRFNSAQPFYTSTLLYVGAFLLAVCSWLKWPEALARAAFWVLAIAFAVTTVGIAVRMWLESRPPVTNLYSSALFVGWGAVALCLVLERIFRNGIGSVAGGLIGFATLVIAHHLALGGDTLEMMRAVLDSNFWLATHVVTIAVGYSATFLAGFLAIIYVLRGVLTRSLDEATARALGRMIYGIVCFATLFSFIGTILGGIWADQSWGRFWGWDPKENGALLIVMWNSIILHVRWAGLVKTRGLACLAIFGNIVTAWSWFGVNMLGVGLHSYGFMDAAFWWLVAFVISQLVLILLAAVPVAKWRSFRMAA
jgi:ABC-type transport system involved in cytochrome c biogenesis permease subunit